MLDDGGGTNARTAVRYQPSYRRLVARAQAYEQRRNIISRIQERSDESLARRVGRLYRHYPWARPGTLLSLAKANIEPGDQAAQWAAALEVRRRDNDPMGWMRPGERAPAGAMDVTARQRSRRARQMESLAGVTAQGSAPTRGDGRPGLFDQIGNVVSEFAPSVRGGGGGSPSGAGQMPVTPGDAQTSGLSADVVDSTVGAVAAAGEGINTALKGTTRAGGALMASPLQATVGNFRDVMRSVGVGDDATTEQANPLAAFAWSAVPAISVPAGMVGYDPFGGGFTGGQTQTGQVVHSAVRDIQSGRTPAIDMGEGFFVDPDSEVERARHEAELARGTIMGSAMTPGRVVAYETVQPGSRAYEVISAISDIALSSPLRGGEGPDAYNLVSGTTDLGVALLADPTNAVLGGTSAGRAAEAGVGRGANQSWGLLDGLRWTVDPDQLTQRLSSEEFRTGAGQFIADADYATIRRATKGRLPAEVEVALADATTVDEVAAALAPRVENGRVTGLGLDVRNPNGILELGDSGLAMRRRVENVRAFNMMPSDTMHLDDASAMTEWTERFLRNAHAPEEMVDEWVEKMARTTPGVDGRNERYVQLRDMLGAAEQNVLVDHFGVDPDLAHDLMTLFDETVADQRAFAVDHTGGHVMPAWADPTVAGGDAEDLLSGIGPLFSTQHSNGILSAPDIRGIRQVTSREWTERLTLAQNYREFREAAYQVYGAGGGGIRAGRGPVRTNLPLSVLMHAQDKVWKPFQLLRGAWAVRVVGEEQFRLVADGLEGFNHPAAWIAWITGRGDDALGSPFDESQRFADSQAQGAMSFLEQDPLSGGRRFGAPTSFLRDASGLENRRGYRRWWANTIAQAAADPVVNRVANNMDDLAAVQEWFRPGNPVFDRLASAHPGPNNNSPLFRRAVSDRYIEQVAQNIRDIAGENPDAGIAANDSILAAFRDGHFTGADGSVVPFNKKGEARVSTDFIDALKPHVPTGPVEVVGRVVEDSSQRHTFVNNMFAALGAYPTNFLSRSPAFRQFYWRRMEEMIPLATPEAQEAIIEGAARTGLGRRQIARLREFAGRSNEGVAGLEAMDDLAKGHALDDTRNLLYDLSERTQFYDIHRLLMPFGEAWQEVMTRWAGLLRRNPRMIRRFQQGITEARSQGFFFTDENGEESFGYPESGPMLNALGVKAPVRLLGGVAGLNMVGQVSPGVGSFVQMGAAQVLPRTNEYSGLRSFLLPYGDQNETATQWMYPPWIERSLQALSSEGDITGIPDPIRGWLRTGADFMGGNTPQAQRSFMTTTNMVMASLYSTGDYGTAGEMTPADWRTLERDARDQAATLTFFRAASSFFAPSAPRPEISVETTQGTVVIAALSEEYQNLQYGDDGPHLSSDAAMRDMLDRYGEQIYMALQGKSVSISIDPPVTTEQGEWAAAHPEVREQYPLIYGLFAPHTDDDQPDPSVMNEQYDGSDPEREPLSPREFRMRANNALAQMQLHEAQRAAGPETERTPEERAALTAFREFLDDQYPGFMDEAGIPGRPTNEEAIAQVIEASQDPDVAEASPEAVEGLNKYLTARQAAADYVDAHPELDSVSFKSSNATAFIRDALRAYAEQIIGDHPAFQPLWERVFSRELKDADLEPQEVTANG